MLRSLARINGDDNQRRVGNTYSQHNRARTQARLNAMKSEGIVPMDPMDEEALRKKELANAKAPKTVSERAIRVPRVGLGPAPQRPPLVDCLPHRRAEEDIRANEGNFVRPAAPLGVPVQSRDSKKDELALRNQFYGKTPQEVLAEARNSQPAARQPAAPPSGVSEERQLHNQIVDEIEDRQAFLDDMTRLGQGHAHRARIESEISERMRDLKRLEPYLQEASGSAAPGGAGGSQG